MSGTRTDTEQADILDSVVKQLLDTIPSLSSKTCFISILPDPPYKVPDNQFVTVAPTGGDFPEEFTDGGGQNQCTEMSGVIVTAFSRFQAYRQGQEREALSNWTRGILRMKRLILKSLVSQDLTWNTNFILRSLVRPKKSGPPDHVGDEALVKIPISFALDFDWNLTA